MKKLPSAGLQFPTLICAWCKDVLRPAGPKVSHGICRPCAKQWFGKIGRKLPYVSPRQAPA